LRAVNRIAATAQKRSGKPFDQIILAVADVDADLFRQYAKAYAEVASREIEDYAKLTGNPGYVGLINTAHPAPNQAADLALPESGDSSTRSVCSDDRTTDANK
jgi:hypothetical protein